MNSFFKSTLLVFLASFVLALFSCSNSSGGGSSDVPAPTGGTATNPTIYTVTFNANYGNPNPTSTQIFYAETPQALKTIEQLGFSKSGFNFAGWGTAANAMTASYSDGAAYTATKDIVLYAIWSSVSVYSVNIPINANGTVTATPATGIAGTEIVLTNTPKPGYKFGSYTVTAADNSIISVTNGKFRMPAQNVRVTATFNAVNYTVNMGAMENETVTANKAVATVGESVALTISPAIGYQLETLTVVDSDGVSATLSGTGNSRTFTMPAQNVTVRATFCAINYTINVETASNGSMSASSATAIVGTTVTLTISPVSGYQLATLTVKAVDGTSVTLSGSGNSRTFTMPAKNVTVTAKFEGIAPASGTYTKIGTTTINGTQYELVTFGLWPQTIKAADVTVNESDTETVGIFKYCKGSDCQWYVKIKEDARAKDYKYSDGTSVSFSDYNRYKWFRVEPIKWRVLTTNYNGTGKKLLLAEKILTICECYKYYGVNRIIGGKIVGPTNYEHSRIRAFLNGLSYQEKKEENATQKVCDEFFEKGFLQTAFTSSELLKIADTRVDNSARSTNPDANAKLWNDGNNPYASDTPTIDKVFLLSEQEVTKSGYGFGAYNATGASSSRIRQTTDFAKAKGAIQEKDYGMCGRWWLRSPYYNMEYGMEIVAANSSADSYGAVHSDANGVVPSLCVLD